MAEVVRREWLATLLSRKTLPKDASPFIAQALTAHRNTIAAAIGNGNRLAASLLSLDAPESYWAASPLDTLAASQPGKAGHIALAVVIGGLRRAPESTHGETPDVTRSPTSHNSPHGVTRCSDVEQIVADATPAERPTPEPDPDDADEVDSDEFED